MKPLITKTDVWDGEAMEGDPEEDPKEIIPFEVVGEGLIRPCSHGHDHLKLILPVDDSYVRLKDKQCFACILQILSGPCYVCSPDECHFILHERCANLPKKIRHPASWSRLTLSFNIQKFHFENNNTCACCKRGGSAFSYAFRDRSLHMFIIDVRCASIKDGFVHASHPHSGLIVLDSSCEDPMVCSICSEDRPIRLKCIECEDFVLCYRCATLPPAVVNHKYDEHPVYLRYGENRNGMIYWCEICETTLDPQSWFYTCDECGSTFHIDCVLGKDPSYRVGFTYFDLGKDIEVVQNNYVTRPYCQGWCSGSSRCQGPVLFKCGDVFCCSSSCAIIYCRRDHAWW